MQPDGKGSANLVFRRETTGMSLGIYINMLIGTDAPTLSAL
jgi:hypothetical protein